MNKNIYTIDKEEAVLLANFDGKDYLVSKFFSNPVKLARELSNI
jgi:hypothetical protein